MNLIEQGADIIDVGGESTKPDATKIPLSLELDRIIPVIQRIRQNSSITLSIDTYKPEVMKAAVNAGANVKQQSMRGRMLLMIYMHCVNQDH